MTQLLRNIVSVSRHGVRNLVAGTEKIRSCPSDSSFQAGFAPWLASAPRLWSRTQQLGCRNLITDWAASGAASKQRRLLSTASSAHESPPAPPSAGSAADGAATGAGQQAAATGEDPFAAEDPQLDLQAHLISDARADTRHFMEQHTFQRPLESSVSVPAKSPGHVEAKLFQNEAIHTLPHPIWTPESTNSVKITHFQPEGLTDRLAWISVRTLRTAFDIFSGYALGRVDERGWLNRICFLETVAGVPGMVGAMIRHLNSLRRMERDYGWIHTLLEEAENERMHLMTALVLKKPTKLFRLGVLMTQGLFLSAFTVAYLASRRYAHRFVGYLEEEAVITYTKLLKEIDRGHLPLFENLPAPPVARDYWCLPDDAMFRDVVLAIRADESHHREVNHTFADLQGNKPNPFPPGH